MIIQRYLIREVIQTFLAVLAILVLIYASKRFVSYLADAAAGSLSSEFVTTLLALKLLESMSVILPLAIYVAILIGLGRLYKDNEVVAMFAGGIGLPTLAQSVFWMSLVFATVSLVLSLYVSPQVAAVQSDMLARAREESQITGVYPGRFKVFRGGTQTVYVEEMASDRRSMQHVFIHTLRESGEEVVVAESAHQVIQGEDARRYVVLENGYRYSGNPGDLDFVVTKFEKHAILLDTEGSGSRLRKHGAIPTLELINSDDPRHKAELQWRVSLPITVVMLGMLAVPLARISPREGKYGKLFTALAVYFVYNNALGVFRSLVERGDLPPAVGVWPVHAMMAFAVGALLLLQSYSPQYLITRVRSLAPGT